MTSQTLVPASLLAGGRGRRRRSLLPAPADAIPAFARKYQFSCYDLPRAVPAAQALRRRVRRRAASGSRTRARSRRAPPTTPAIRCSSCTATCRSRSASTASRRTRRTPTPRPTSSGRGSVKLLSGGPITDRISYYFYFIFEKGESTGSRTPTCSSTTSSACRSTWSVGQFQVCDPLFKRELRLERDDYEIFKTRVGIAADRPHLRPRHRARLARSRRDRGRRSRSSTATASTRRRTATSTTTVQEHRPAPGRSSVRCASASSATGARRRARDGASTKITYFGPDLRSRSCDKWQLNVQYLERRDDDPFLVGRDRTRPHETTGASRSSSSSPQGQDGRWVLAASTTRSTPTTHRRFENASLTLNHLLARNVRRPVEGDHDIELERRPRQLRPGHRLLTSASAAAPALPAPGCYPRSR